MFKVLLSFCLLFTVQSASAKLIDKIAGVIDDVPVTTSELKQISKNFELRTNIAPFMYKEGKNSNEDIFNVIIQSKIIRDKLAEFGFIVSDEQVDENIKKRNVHLGLSHKDLVNYLRSNKMSYNEYFELTREALEYSLFVDRVISPLISITDQDLKNEYYKKYKSTKTMSFKYNLVDFVIAKKLLTKKDLKTFRKTLIDFQTTGNLPAKFESLATNQLGELSEEGLTKDLKKVLQETDEGTFTNPITLGDDYHVMFVKKKDLVESEDYIQMRNRLRMELLQKLTDEMTETWIKGQLNGHYVKFYKK